MPREHRSTDGAEFRETRFLLQRAHRRLRASIADALSPYGVGVGHFAVLGLLSFREGLTQAQLIERLEVDRTSMVGLVDELERRGLAERRPVPGDRRAHAAHLTDAGRAAASDLSHLVKEAEAKFLGSLSEEEQTQLQDLLRRVVP